jgi:hypothetical protein
MEKACTAGVSAAGVTKDTGTARCVVVPSSQLTGSAVSEGQVVFSVLFVPKPAAAHSRLSPPPWLYDVELYLHPS